MIDTSWQSTVVSKFRGAQTYLDTTEGRVEDAIEAINCEFREDGDTVRTRTGFGIAIDVSEKSSGSFNWVSELGNYLVWLNPGVGVKIARIDGTFTPSTLIVNTTASHAQFCANGNRLYVALLDSTQRSNTSAYVITRITGTFYADQLFAPPMMGLAATTSEPTTGRVTAGVHYGGVIIEHRGGFIGRPSPDTGVGTPDTTTFARFTFTATGSKNASVTLTPTPGVPWPASAVKVHLILTPVSNKALFMFVPDKVVDVTGGTTTPITFTWDLSDDEMRQAARDDSNLLASKSLLLETQTTLNVASLTPYCIFTYGDRMGYVVQITEPDGNQVCSLLLSERGNAEQIMLTRSLIRLPGQLPITLAFELNEQTCILGPNQTFTTSDTGGDPVQWRIPTSRNAVIGTPSFRGVDVNAKEGYAIVASKTGLFSFNGFDYSTLPISYAQTDKWNTINWAYARHLIVKNDISNRVVYVLAPTGDTPTYELWAWSYKNFDPRNINQWWKAVDFSEITIPEYAFGDLCVVQNDRSTAVSAAYNKLELWLMTRSAASHIRRKKIPSDENPYRDGTDEQIECAYTPGNVPPNMGAAFMMHHGVQVKASGSGRLNIEAIAINTETDGSTEVNYMEPPPLDLVAAATEYELYPTDLIAPKVRYRFTNLDEDSHFVLHFAKFYYSVYSLY